MPKASNKPEVNRGIFSRRNALIAAVGALGTGIAADRLGLFRFFGGRNDKIREPEKTPEKQKATADEIFSIPESSLSIPRAQIPEKLQGLLEGLGTVIKTPEHYDESKPNLYLIANAHTKSEDGVKRKEGYKTQKEILKIFHRLFPLGAKKQFLEGVPEGMDVQHNVRHSRIGEIPLTALPKYKRTGSINRAYIAIEGIYGERVKSLGTEDWEKNNRIRRMSRQVSFDKALFKIVQELSNALNIPFDYSELKKSRKYAELMVQRIREKIKNSPDIDVQKLINEIVLKNQAFLEWLEVLTERYYERIQGRNVDYQKIINREASTNEDSVFIVGAHHIEHLQTLIEGYNVFVIKPKSVDSKSLTPYFSHFSKDDYRANLLEYDSYLFGLNDLPENRLFNNN